METCSSAEAIRSHTVQRRGGLRLISEDGHAYSAKKGFVQIGKIDGKVGLEKIGVADASTFPGFCNHHDSRPGN
ncbi:hypothetical protein C7H84_21860 [Burkholderia sp. Nafp2/4-1b]|nr:hypothetical protein C7H84_21860 [Burkholderia sp. Nafp2/4-1b]